MGFKMIEEIQNNIKYINELNKYWSEELKTDLDIQQVKDVNNLFNSNIIKSSINILNKPDAKFSLENLNDLHRAVEEIQFKLNRIKENAEVDKLYIKGEMYNWDKLEKEYKKSLKKQFPKFKFNVFKEWVGKPKKEMITKSGERIVFDPFIIKKMNSAILQMIFDEMDFWALSTGQEGAGKTCWSSQLVYYVYTLLYECGLITYKYDLEFFVKASIKEMLDIQTNLPDDSLFNIFILDEAEDLLRSNHANKENKRFIRHIRRSRKQRNIVFLNTPQIGEINLSVTTARVNFIFDCKMYYRPETGLLDKGYCDFYIIPRADEIYSRRYRRNIGKEYIKNTLLRTFEAKTTYYAGLPKDIMISQFRFKGVWGFDKDIYDKHIRAENKERELEDDIKLTKRQAECLNKALPDFKYWNWEIDPETDKRTKESQKEYDVINKWKQRLNKKILKMAKETQ